MTLKLHAPVPPVSRTADADHSGLLTADELRVALQRQGKSVTEVGGWWWCVGLGGPAAAGQVGHRGGWVGDGGWVGLGELVTCGAACLQGGMVGKQHCMPGHHVPHFDTSQQAFF